MVEEYKHTHTHTHIHTHTAYDRHLDKENKSTVHSEYIMSDENKPCNQLSQNKCFNVDVFAKTPRYRSVYSVFLVLF